MTFSKNKLYNTLLLGAIFISSILNARQIIVKYQGESKSAIERFNWAIGEASDLDSYWVGYQFDRMMHENSWIGSWSSNDDENRPSLASILGEPEPEGFRDWSLEQTAKMALKGLIEKKDKGQKVNRKVAILLRYKRHTSNPQELAAVEVSNTSLRVRLKNKPLYWLGNCSQTEGLSLLKKVMSEDPVNRVREDLITAYAMHDSVPELANMLNTIATTDKNKDVREKAVFWIGQQQRPEALEMLKKIVRSNDVDDVREKAVFSISQIKNEAALEELISLAKTHGDQDIREKAIFWLSQRASKKATKTLEDIAYSADEIEIKEKAIFAISQRDDPEAVNKLIEIANDHPSVEIRRKAIFWLGQSEDPRAVDALVKLSR